MQLFRWLIGHKSPDLVLKHVLVYKTNHPAGLRFDESESTAAILDILASNRTGGDAAMRHLRRTVKKHGSVDCDDVRGFTRQVDDEEEIRREAHAWSKSNGGSDAVSECQVIMPAGGMFRVFFLMESSRRTALKAILQGSARCADEVALFALLGEDLDLVHLTRTDGFSLVHKFAAIGNAKCVEVLLAKGAAVDTRDNQGHTALHFACTGGSADVVKVLLKGGADVNVTSADGLAPIQIAAAKAQHLLDLLLKSGADAKVLLPGRK